MTIKEKWISVLAVMILAAAVPLAVSETKPGAKAPDFTLTGVNGQPVQLSALKGKIVVLEWTNYDCPFVKPHYGEQKYTMRDLAARYADKNVVWLTINSTHYATVETTRAWAEKHQLKQKVLVDKDGNVGKRYGAKTTPHIFIVNAAGNIAYRGAIDNSPRGRIPEGQEYVNYVDVALAELTAGKDVTVTETQSYGCSVKYPPAEKTQ